MDQVNLRKAPSISADIKSVLSKGVKVVFYDLIRDAEGNEWTQVYITQTGEAGYVFARYISPQ